MKRTRHVLFASDLSSASRRAFATAVSLATSLGAKLTIVHVLAPFVPVIPEQYLDTVTLDELERQTRRWSTRELSKLAGAAAKAGIRASTEIRTGDPVEQILRAARLRRAGFIVLGTHARRGLPKFFLGSVAERVVATAPCPVVTVRGK